MADEGYLLSKQQYDDLRAVILDFKARTGKLPPLVGPNIQHVRITGPEVDGYYTDSYASCDGAYGYDETEYYPGIVTAWDASAKCWRDYGICWVKDANDDGLEVGDMRTAKQSGNKTIAGQNPETRPLFVIAGGGSGGGGITIRVVDCVQPFFYES